MKTLLSNNKKLIAVIGATGHQGGGVVRALQASGQFKVRALTRNPGKHRELADEVVEADLNRPETLAAAFKGGIWRVSRHHFFVRRNRRAQAGSRRGAGCQGCRRQTPSLVHPA